MNGLELERKEMRMVMKMVPQDDILIERYNVHVDTDMCLYV